MSGLWNSFLMLDMRFCLSGQDLIKMLLIDFYRTFPRNADSYDNKKREWSFDENILKDWQEFNFSEYVSDKPKSKTESVKI